MHFLSIGCSKNVNESLFLPQFLPQSTQVDSKQADANIGNLAFVAEDSEGGLLLATRPPGFGLQAFALAGVAGSGLLLHVHG